MTARVHMPSGPAVPLLTAAGVALGGTPPGHAKRWSCATARALAASSGTLLWRWLTPPDVVPSLPVPHSFIADLAVGTGCGHLKSGAPARGERTAKYNSLLEIAAGSQLRYGMS